jgi:hypothetical protein
MAITGSKPRLAATALHGLAHPPLVTEESLAE